MNHYETLGVSVNATIDEIKSMYEAKKAMLKNIDTNDARQHEEVLFKAYAILSDPFLKENYDQSLIDVPQLETIAPLMQTVALEDDNTTFAYNNQPEEPTYEPINNHVQNESLLMKILVVIWDVLSFIGIMLFNLIKILLTPFWVVLSIVLPMISKFLLVIGIILILLATWALIYMLTSKYATGGGIEKFYGVIVLYVIGGIFVGADLLVEEYF